MVGSRVVLLFRFCRVRYVCGINITEGTLAHVLLDCGVNVV